jgi:hypothetical protein
VLDDEEAIKASNGVAVRSTVNGQRSTIRLMHHNRLLAIAEPRDDQLKPIVVFK